MKLYGNKKTALLFIAPALLFVLLFIYYPIAKLLHEPLQMEGVRGRPHVGRAKYYRRIAQDPVLHGA